MKKVLLIQFSQSGQLTRIAKKFVQPLVDDPNVELVFENLEPAVAYPFPWPFVQFFDTFPESVYLDPPKMAPFTVRKNDKFDLVIVAYQVWFLSPAGPIVGFLQSDTAKAVLNDTPVVTLIACRNMWLVAQEKMKTLLSDCGAKLVGNVALIDEAGGALSFFSTPSWVLTGNKGAKLGGLIPAAGVAEHEIEACDRFGDRISQVFSSNAVIDETLLQGLGAVNVNERYIASEHTAHRGFKIWGKLLRSVGPSGDPKRKPILLLYATFLILFICTFIPLSVLLKALIAPFTKARVLRQKQQFEQPSGSSTENLV